jgi:hypothetical protein
LGRRFQAQGEAASYDQHHPDEAQPPALRSTLSSETAALINKFVAIDQHSRNTHGPMSIEKLVTMWLEDVAAAMKTIRRGRLDMQPWCSRNMDT